MRPIPATSLGHAHGLLRAIEKRGRLRTDEFVTEFSLEELFPPGPRERARPAAPLHLLRAGRRARQGGSRRRRADRSRPPLHPLRRRRRAVRHLPGAGRMAAPPAAREAHDGLDLPRAGDRAQPARVVPAGHARGDDGLRALDGLPRPSRLGQREHVRDPGRAPPDPAHRTGADRRRAPPHAHRRAGAQRADAAGPHVADRHRRPAQPGRRRTPSAPTPSANGRKRRPRRRRPRRRRPPRSPRQRQTRTTATTTSSPAHGRRPTSLRARRSSRARRSATRPRTCRRVTRSQPPRRRACHRPSTAASVGPPGAAAPPAEASPAEPVEEPAPPPAEADEAAVAPPPDDAAAPTPVADGSG